MQKIQNVHLLSSKSCAALSQRRILLFLQVKRNSILINFIDKFNLTTLTGVVGMVFFKRKINLIIAGTCIVYLFSGCAKAPDAELAAAKAALKAAQDVEADKFMSKNFQNVQKVIEEADKEIAKQKSSFFLTRKYTRVTKLLVNATTIATEIAKDAPEAKKNIVAQVTENLALSKSMLKETAEDIKKASRSKDKSVIEELNAILSTADSAATLAATDFAAGDVLKASEDLNRVQALIKSITDQLKVKSEEM